MHRMTHSRDQLTFSKPLSHVTWPSRRLPIHRRNSHAVLDSSRISTWFPPGCARFTYTLQRTTLSSLRRIRSAEDSFCGGSILRRTRSAEDPFCRKRSKGRSRFRELHSLERETRREPDQEKERNVSRWEAGARLLRMHVADSTCSGIPAHHCRFVG